MPRELAGASAAHGTAYGRLGRALDSGNDVLILSTARQLPRVALNDALRICLVLRDGEGTRRPAETSVVDRVCDAPGGGSGEWLRVAQRDRADVDVEPAVESALHTVSVRVARPRGSAPTHFL